MRKSVQKHYTLLKIFNEEREVIRLPNEPNLLSKIYEQLDKSEEPRLITSDTTKSVSWIFFFSVYIHAYAEHYEGYLLGS